VLIGLIDIIEEGMDCLMKSTGVIIIFCIQDFLFGKFPQALNNVEIGRIRRKEKQSDTQTFGKVFYNGTMLITGIVQYNRYGFITKLFFELFEKFNKHIGVNIGRIDVRYDFFLF
jgi:hypothetical protein